MGLIGYRPFNKHITYGNIVCVGRVIIDRHLILIVLNYLTVPAFRVIKIITPYEFT